MVNLSEFKDACFNAGIFRVNGYQAGHGSMKRWTTPRPTSERMLLLKGFLGALSDRLNLRIRLTWEIGDLQSWRDQGKNAISTNLSCGFVLSEITRMHGSMPEFETICKDYKQLKNLPNNYSLQKLKKLLGLRPLKVLFKAFLTDESIEWIINYSETMSKNKEAYREGAVLIRQIVDGVNIAHSKSPKSHHFEEQDI